MAVTKIQNNSVLRLELQVGVNAGGNPVFRTKSLSNVKPGASDQHLFDVATALADLQLHPLNDIARVDSAQLAEA